MVDVSEKQVSHRVAIARSVVSMPPEVIAHFTDGDIKSKKGSVFQTAIIAGIMGAKRTAELIPLCHPLGLDNCKVDIHINEQNEVIIDCTASITAKTGIELEALVGASVAALTVYDMCKALNKSIVIEKIHLLSKSGGKSGDFSFDNCQVR